MSDISEVVPGCENVQEFLQNSLKAVSRVLHLSNSVPLAGSEEFDYYSCFSSFRTFLANEKSTVLSLMTSLMPSFKLHEHFANLESDDQLEVIKDINSLLFENLGNLLDEASGVKKPADKTEELATCTSTIPINASWNKKYARNSIDKSQNYTLLCSKNIPRPQYSFKVKVDNSNTIFVPIIKEKPNSIKPLSVILEKNENKEEFSHPYEVELVKFEPHMPHLQLNEPVIPRSLEDTPLIFVDTEEKLNDMYQDLKNQKEIAIDIEHHSYRSFQGFSCLIQISTRCTDYIIDVIELRCELPILNEVFTDPKIVKVFHGADMDVLWLQRDFGLYIVNMFDTGQAARLLNFAHLSLAFLLKHYCKLEVDKQFQLADWRIRPIPQDMLKYAREDTHYLLYVYDCLKNDLAKNGNELNNLLISVFQRSKEVCLKKYEKILFKSDSYFELYRKSRKNFNPRQLFCFKQLYAWRDGIARLEDESYGYVLPNHMLLQIAETLPREVQGIRACCNPLPPLVSQNILELHGIVCKALHTSLAELEESKTAAENVQIESSVDLSNILQSPHDIHSYCDGKTVIHTFPGCASRDASINYKNVNVPLKPKVSLLFGNAEIKEDQPTSSENVADRVMKSIAEGNKTPYERYLLTLKYHAAQEANNKQKPSSSSLPEEQKQFIETFNDATSISDVNTSSTSVKTEAMDEEIIESLQINKKREKKKKRQLAEVVTVTDTKETEDNAIKKIKLFEPLKNTATSKRFQPFDYKAASTNAAESRLEKRKSNASVFGLSDKQDANKASRNQNRKRNDKHSQGRYSSHQKGSDLDRRKWPKC